MRRIAYYWQTNWDSWFLWFLVCLAALAISWLLGAFDNTATAIRSGY